MTQHSEITSEGNPSPEESVADEMLCVSRTIARLDRYGCIAAEIVLQRFVQGGVRFGVRFDRNTSDLFLQGPVIPVSLGQDELFDLIRVAFAALRTIDSVRGNLKQPESQRQYQLDVPVAQLQRHAEWQVDDEMVYAEQIETL